MRLGFESVAPGGFVAGGEFFLDGLEAEFHGGKNLDHAVVELARDAAALGFLRFADERGQAAQGFLGFLAAGDVARNDHSALGQVVLVEDPVPDGFEGAITPVFVTDANLGVPALAVLEGLLPGLGKRGAVIGMDEFDELCAGHFLRLIAEARAVRRAGVEEAAIHVHEADQVECVLRDETVLFLAAAQGGFGLKAGAFHRLLLQRVFDRGGKALEAGLEDVIIRAFVNAFHGDFF